MKLVFLGRTKSPNAAMRSHRGLGDTIESITTATGVKHVVKAIANAVDADCGCEERKDTLNRIFPYNTNNNGNSESNKQ